MYHRKIYTRKFFWEAPQSITKHNFVWQSISESPKKEHYTMNELIFIVEPAPEGGYIARALDVSIYTEADNIIELRHQIRDAVHCHFDSSELPKMIRLHFVHDEVLAA